MNEVKTSLFEIIINYGKGYLRNLYLSWSLFIGVFLVLMPIVLIPSFLLLIIDKIIPGTVVSFEKTFVYNAMLNFFVFLFKDWVKNVKVIGLFFLFILPLISFITTWIFKKSYEKIEHKVFVKYFKIAAIVNIVCFILVLIFGGDSQGTIGSRIWNGVGITIAFFIVAYIGIFFYWLSEVFENISAKNGEIKYKDDWKEEKIVFRNATLKDIEQIQMIESEYYEGFSLPKAILNNWIKKLSNNFIIAEKDNEIMGFIFYEYLTEMKALPFVHEKEHDIIGKYVYISEVGVLDKYADYKILDRLYDEMFTRIKKDKRRFIIWLTGEKMKHDKIEKNLLIFKGFVKKDNIKHWECFPETFVDDHYIWLKKI
jgi:hypothetical protein